MSPYIEKYKRNIAVEMRTKGLSYSEIENQIHVPVSTLSYWLKKIKLTEDQKKKLNEKRSEAIKRGLEKKIFNNKKAIEEIKNNSAKSIKGISGKELWLMGITLYWRERLLNGNESDLRKGVKFTSSDPYLVKLFLKWLKDIGRIEDEEIEFDIFLDARKRGSINEAKAYWSDVTDFPESKLSRIYFQKTKTSKKRHLRNTKKTNMGLLRTRVKSSSMLARQIAGWVKGIVRYYWD